MQVGTRLGPYEVLSPIGKGGMGEVWKARDTRLRREVAIKTLPTELAREPARLARLTREAELLAALNHPNVAVIHGIEEHGETRALILELVEGETLQDRIERGGAIPVSEALTLALQIAQALEAAHGKGVIHRDLKPANVKVTPEGRVKVLDFGLAKALGPAHSDDLATPAAGLTHTGVVLGTPAYMSPEQARGEAAGFQADIWSFGAVLYELLTGTSPFLRRTLAETLASILGAEPDYAALPSETPAIARRLVRRCLEKHPSRRVQHIGDARIDLEDALAPSEPLAAGTGRPAGVLGARPGSLWIAGLVLFALLAGLAGFSLARRPAAEPLRSSIRVSLPFRERPAYQPYGTRHLAISEDGSNVAYASLSRLWLRRLDQKDAVALASGQAFDPFFSPDGEWVGWFSQTGLFKAPARGGPPETIVTNTDRPAGAVWRADGTILFATSEGLYRVSASGGPSRLIAKPDRGANEALYGWPQLLPGGESVLLTIVTDHAGGGVRVATMDLGTLERKTVVEGGSCARYLASGHLVYASGSALRVVAFDPAARASIGQTVSLPEIELGTALDNGAASFALSDSGTLVFTTPPEPAPRRLQWMDRRGRAKPLPIEPEGYVYPSISPDGMRVALDRNSRGHRDIWILDLERMTQTRLTDNPAEDMMPTWSQDGRRVFFASIRNGNFDVYSQAADGATSARVEFESPDIQAPVSVTPDGTRLLVQDRFEDIGVLDLANPGRLEPLLHSDFDERLAEVSPDGRWVAYESNESGGEVEIMLRSFPNVGERREKISVNGGRYPEWGPKGSDELYYVNPEGGMMAASVRLSPTLALGPVTKLFDGPKPIVPRSGKPYDVSPLDGRFLVIERTTADTEVPTDVSVVFNLQELLRQARGR
ncbi:MAG: protein kinase [Vicinamibacterales bacterium]